MKHAKTILLIALLAGTLDIIAAIAHFKLTGGGNPVQIFRFIASGVFGSRAFDSGGYLPILGLVFHYLITGAWTVFYFLTYPLLLHHIRNPYVSGVVYGLLVWVVMNLVILPLSNTPEVSRNVTQDLTGMIILVMAIGLPVAIGYDQSVG